MNTATWRNHVRHPTPGNPLVDPYRGGLGHLRDLAGQHRGERGTALDPARPAPEPGRAGVGGQRLHPGLRQPAVGRRPAGRPVRPAAAVPGRAGPVHRRVAGGRARQHRGRAHRRPGRAGRGCGVARPDHPGHHLHDLPPGAGAQPGHRRVERRRRARPGARPADRRAARPALALERDLLRQRAGRPGHPHRRAAGHPRVPRHSRPLARPARPGRLHGRAVRAHLRPDQRSRGGLDLADGRRVARAGRDRRGGLRPNRGPGTGGTAAMMLWGLAVKGIYFFTSLYLQAILGLSPTTAGAAFVPLALLMAAGAPLASALTSRIGAHRTVAAGFVLVAAGLLAVSRLGAGAGLADLMPGFVLVGVGSGLTTPLTASILGVVPPERAGVASGILNAAREVSALLGVTVIGAILTTRQATALDRGAGPSRAFLAGYTTGLVAAVVLMLDGALLTLHVL